MEIAIEEFGKQDGMPAKKAAIEEWAKHLTEPFTLMINDVTALGEDHVREMSQALRSVRDSGTCPKLRVVIAGRNEQPFFDTPTVSGLYTLSHSYRPHAFAPNEIKILAAWNKKIENQQNGWSALKLSNDAVERIVRHSGGQPLLVYHLLRQLQRLMNDTGKKITKEIDVDKASRLFRQSPPEVIRSWRDDLRHLLENDKDLLERIRSYVKGRTVGPINFPPPDDERELFLSGWLKQSPLTNRWGITSEFHAHLVRELLDDLQ
jgi:hypothetical protein